MYACVCAMMVMCVCAGARWGRKRRWPSGPRSPRFPCGVAQALTRCKGAFYLHCMRPRARALHTYRPFSCRTIGVDDADDDDDQDEDASGAQKKI